MDPKYQALVNAIREQLRQARNEWQELPLEIRMVLEEEQGKGSFRTSIQLLIEMLS